MDPLDVKEVLEKHQHEFLYFDDINAFRITVRRSSIWDDALRAVNVPLMRGSMSVSPLLESAVDGGGPRREFFMLLMNTIRENNSVRWPIDYACSASQHNCIAE